MAVPTHHDALRKISIGLDEMQRLKDGLDKSPLAGLLNAPRSSAAVLDMYGKAKGRALRYVEWCDAIQVKLANLEQDENEKAAKIPGLRADQRATIVKLAMVDHRNRLRTQGVDGEMYRDRTRIRAEFNEMVRLLGLVKQDFESNIGALNRAMLGSEKRRAFAADVASAGPRDLDSYLRHAAKIGGEEGKALAAACFQRMDELAEKAPDVRNRVTVSKDEIAGVLIGRECSAALAVIENAGILFDEISIKSADLDGREVSQLARDALLMRRHTFAEQFPQPKVEDDNQEK